MIYALRLIDTYDKSDFTDAPCWRTAIVIVIIIGYKQQAQ